MKLDAALLLSFALGTAAPVLVPSDSAHADPTTSAVNSAANGSPRAADSKSEAPGASTPAPTPPISADYCPPCGMG